ncbi:hypothetical protein ACTIVE_5930 [Actinomadura verrucosospora]|uniref:Uncharacterized protein n=1 Tax=Actinomadura verrucosospora TaxID=46165 RepID=A0A7D4A8Y7_ACTVE|nr:hypothetical protein ACTIVE_5930 [Actinomadura verrucosospora]
MWRTSRPRTGRAPSSRPPRGGREVRASADVVRVNGRPSGHRTKRRQRSRSPSVLRHYVVCDVRQRVAAMPRFPADCDGRRLQGSGSSAVSCRRHGLTSQLRTPSRPGSRSIPFQRPLSVRTQNRHDIHILPRAPAAGGHQVPLTVVQATPPTSCCATRLCQWERRLSPCLDW